MKIQKLLGLILVSTTISLPVVQAVSAFIERSCNLEGWRGSTFDKAFNQAINFAAIASRRLKDTNDVDAQNYFSYVFGSNNNKDEVLRILDGLSSTTKTNNRRQSDIRLYCDNDERWEPASRTETQPADQRKYIDYQNRMKTRGKPICKTPKGFAVTYKVPYTKEVGHVPQRDGRSVITFCNNSFKPTENGMARLLNFEDIHLNGGRYLQLPGYEPWNIDKLGIMTVFIIHELTHTNTWGTRDSRKRDSYGWNNVRAMAGTNDAITNADSYSLFCLACGLENYSIGPSGDVFARGQVPAKRDTRRKKRLGSSFDLESGTL